MKHLAMMDQKLTSVSLSVWNWHISFQTHLLTNLHPQCEHTQPVIWVLPSSMHLQCPPQPLDPLADSNTQACTLTLFSAGLRGRIISTGVTFNEERCIDCRTHSLCLLESFCPIRSHWWGSCNITSGWIMQTMCRLQHYPCHRHSDLWPDPSVWKA